MVVRSDGPWKDEVKESGGVDVVLDPVGGDRFTDSLRCLREAGRCLVVGFTGGSIPEVKVNRLLLNNIEVVGAGVGRVDHGQARARPPRSPPSWSQLIESGAVRPDRGRLVPAGAGPPRRWSSSTHAGPPAKSC